MHTSQCSVRACTGAAARARLTRALTCHARFAHTRRMPPQTSAECHPAAHAGHAKYRASPPRARFGSCECERARAGSVVKWHAALTRQRSSNVRCAMARARQHIPVIALHTQLDFNVMVKRMRVLVPSKPHAIILEERAGAGRARQRRVCRHAHRGRSCGLRHASTSHTSATYGLACGPP